MFKKWISVLLCAALLLSGISFCIGAENGELPFLVAADLHYDITPYEVPANYPGEKYYTANIATTMDAESGAIVKQFLRQAAQSDAQCILICGDMTDNGTTAQQQSLANMFHTFEQATGKQIYVINGNHDFYQNISIDTFKAQYADFGYDRALTVDPNSCSYTADLSPKYRLLALDTCNHIDAADGVSPSLLDWADAQAAQAAADGKELIVMMHHNFLEHIEMQSVLMEKYIISSKWEMKKRLLQWGVRYVFTGHQHAQDITAYTESGTNRRVFDIMTTAMTCYPCAYRSAVLGEDGLLLKTERITGVQRADLPKAGYTDELLLELTTDLDRYAYGCFSMNFKERKVMFFSAEAIANILRSHNLSFLQGIASAYFPTFFAYFDTPIYERDAGEDGICLEKMAKELGLELPQSDYRTITDLLYYFVTVYYYGDEALPYTDSQIELFMQCFYTVLYTSLRDVSETEKEAILSDLRTNFKTSAVPYALTKFGQTLVGAAKDTRVLQILSVILSPIVESFSQDDSVPDNDVLLSAADEAPDTAVQFIARIIEWIVHFFMRYVNGMNRLAHLYDRR